MDFVRQFAGELRRRSVDREKEGAATAAGVYSRVADELEQEFQQYLQEEITIEEAARESGYNRDVLRRMRKDGVWSGRRADLPTKPRKAVRQAAPESASARGKRRGLTLAQEITAREVGGVANKGGAR